MKEEGPNEETLTAIPQAARGAAPVCTSTLLSLVSISSDSPPIKHTHSRLFSSAGTGGHNRREGSGGWGKQTEREGSGRGLTNESRQVTFTDVKGRKRRRGRR